MPISFDPLVAEWFSKRFSQPTEPQSLGWPEIRAGRDVLISAPTGSGKTLAAFLLCILAILLFRERWSFSILAACGGATVGILLTGSRSIFLGFAWILALAAVLFARHSGRRISLASAATGCSASPGPARRRSLASE